ncbi:MAG: hypothetical protein U9Q29_04735 [Campylobacterota bacterium]|nr:hypothetical protein [Campylobacterota bacterium]
MSRLIQAFLTGIFFTFIIDFFVILGVKLNYIDFYEIDVYYNELFADHQNIFIYTFFTIIFGFLVTYVDNYKLSISIIGTLFIISTLTLIAPVGHKVGEVMLMKKNVTYKNNKFSFRGDVYYDGRTHITFYDNELKKIILLNKKELIE